MKYSHSIYYILLFLQTKMKYFFKIVLNKLPSAFIIMEELLRLSFCLLMKRKGNYQSGLLTAICFNERSY